MTPKHLNDFVQGLPEKDLALLACTFYKCQWPLSEDEFKVIKSDCVYLGSFVKAPIPLERRAIGTEEIRVDYCKRRAERYYNGVL